MSFAAKIGSDSVKSTKADHEYFLNPPIEALGAGGREPIEIRSIDRTDPNFVWTNSRLGRHRLKHSTLILSSEDQQRLDEHIKTASFTANTQGAMTPAKTNKPARKTDPQGLRTRG